MFLSKIQLDRRRWDVVHDLDNRDRLHKKVMSFFPEIPGGYCENARQLQQVLFRVENTVMIMQSKLAPDLHEISGYILVSSLDVDRNYTSIQKDRRYRFRIDANTSRQLPEDDGEWVPETDSALQTKRKFRRVGCGTFEARSQWFESAGRRHGFKPENFMMDQLPPIKVGREGALEATRFQGFLTVVDLPLFMLALIGGIGQGKAYGLGLLSLKNA